MFLGIILLAPVVISFVATPVVVATSVIATPVVAITSAMPL